MVMTDVEVLTKDTAQVTAGKKYGARTSGADKDSLLAEMRPHRTDHRDISDAAKAGLAIAAVYFTLTRTEYAGINIIP